MNSALWAAKTGLDAQQTRMTVVSNNLANASTNGFKKDRAVFEDLLYQNVKQVGGATSQDTTAPTGLNLGTGVRIVATEKNYTQGGVNNTGNALDVAVNGRGFFQVLMPDGSFAYTRDGSFPHERRRRTGDRHGYKLQPAISVPTGAQSITIGADGAVTAQNARSGGAPPRSVPLQLTDFVNPSGLQPRGENLLSESAASGPAQTSAPGLSGMGTLQQGSLEGSNVMSSRNW